ncbi:MAG: porin family protein [Candidatus Pseudobacter hemicellulosilyticus]|uniref:Porin family protein n=1 Tax=Candidatus Pseudobacter hemicellulosilyticus TaxID=3121375 RepID=A0AAJ5WQB8_9BACT|nr:MAG: porin family protein [Pseudobacter sp.]
MKLKVTLVFLLLASASQAQQWHFGPKLDLNLTQVDGKGIKSSYTTGVQAGGFLQRELNTHWGLQTELLYTLSNVTRTSKFTTYYNINGRSNSREKFRLNSIGIPLLVRYELSERFTLLAGPQYSYLFATNENLVRNQEAFTKSEFSANLGGQFNIGGFSLSVRWNKGLNDINDIDDRYSWHSSRILVGFAVRIK